MARAVCERGDRGWRIEKNRVREAGTEHRERSKNSRVIRRSWREGSLRGLAWILRSPIGVCGSSMSFGTLTGTTSSHLSLLPSPADGNSFHEFLRKAGFSLTTGNPPRPG